MLEAKVNQYIVLVNCKTYNQAAYIEDAMNGFCMQKTTFPFICAIVDDASTDGEQEVIKKYLQQYFDLEDKSFVRNEETDDYMLTLARHKTNKNCYFAVFFLKYNHYLKKSKFPYIKRIVDNVKYIAYCEGDDYWIDSLKLQRQISFLEEHSDFYACFHNALVTYQKHKREDHLLNTFHSGIFNTQLILQNWQISFASLIIRKEVLTSPIYSKLTKNQIGGINLFLASSCLGKVYGFSEVKSVYRKNEGGTSYKMSPAFIMDAEFKIYYFFNDDNIKKTMDKRAFNYMYKYMYPYLTKESYAIELKKTIDKYNKKIFYRVFIKYLLFAPFSRIKKLYRL